jgi:hypothetical protein
MASFKLITENKTELYYKKYEFKVVFKISHIGRTRYCKDFKALKDRIAFLRSKGWIASSFTWTKERTTTFQNYFLWKSNFNTEGASIRLCMNSLSVYANDIEILKQIAPYFENYQPVYKQAIANVPGGIKYFKRNPPTKYRVYFKNTKVSNDFYRNLKDFFERYENSSTKFYPNKSLKYWLNYNTGWTKNWIRDSFNIGYDNESDYTILALSIPEALGLNFKLEKQ